MEFDAAKIAELQAVDGNEFCADCAEPNPEWASINLGILICLHCSGAHRSMGTHVSQVRSLKLDNCWDDAAMLEFMKSTGNEKSNAVLEAFVPPFIPRPSDYPEHDGVRQRFIRLKYELKRFTSSSAFDSGWNISSREGFLLKQSKDDLSKWQKRWIVLSEGALAYYRQQDAETPAGLIKLNSGASIVPTGLDLAVCAAPGERVYQLRAGSMDDLWDWLVALRAARSVGGRGSMVRRALGSSSGMASSASASIFMGSPKSGPVGGLPIEALELEDEDEDEAPGSKVLVKLAEQVFAAGPVIARQGWLFRRSGKIRVQWKKRFVVLAQGILYVFRASYPGPKWKDPQTAMSVIGASCDVSNKSVSSKWAFAVRTPETQMVLACEDEADSLVWIRAIRGLADSHATNGASEEV